MFENILKNKKIENAKAAVAKNPNNIIKLDILGKIYTESNFYDEAVSVYEKILKIDETYLPALNSLSRIYLKTKQYLKAYRTLKLLYKLSPDDFQVKTALLTLKDAECDIEAKVEILKGLLEINPSTDIREKLAQKYLESGQFSQSTIVYENLYSENENPEYLIKLSEIYTQLQKYSKVSECLEKLMQTDLFTYEYAEMLADNYVKENRLEEAKGLLELLIENSPQKAEILNEKLAKILALEQNPDKVIEITNNVIKNNKYSVDSKFLQADALLDKKEYKEAVEFLREFYCDPVDKDTEKRIEEKIILASILYSQTLRSEKKYVEAIDALTPALRYDENNKNIYIELARISTEIRDYSAAKEYMKIADELQ